MTTDILRLDELVASQSSKEVTHNTALRQLEAQTVRALDRDLTAAPASPVNGNVYIVGPSATGIWAGHEDDIAHFYAGSWKYYAPTEGITLWLCDEDLTYTFDGTTWVASGGAGTSAPFVDSTAIIKGSADPTKLLKLEIDGFTTATTRTITVPNASGTMALVADMTAHEAASNPHPGYLTQAEGDALYAAIAGAVSDGDKGDITVSASGATWTIDSTVISTFGRTLTDDADAAGARTTLGLGTAATLASDTDTTLAANSDTRLATQKAVKTYIDGIVTGGASDVMIFKGVIDCSANPNYPAADAGNLYKISVAGKIGGASGPNVEVGDTLYCITDATSAGTQAAVGANWNISQVNVDGAVTGPASAVSHNVARFNSTTGKIIEDSGLTLAGTNTGDETVTTAGALISGATAKTTPVDADYVGLMDSAASNVLKKLSWANIKASLKTYFDTLYAATSQPFDLTAFWAGATTASALVTRVPVARAITFADDFAGSYGVASVAATASTAFDVQKNGASVGAITFALGATTATFVTSGTTVVMAAGDYLSIIAPASPDATLANIGFVLTGTR